MKRKLYLIIMLAAVTLSGMAQTIGEEMYIYRNDGQVNGFLPDEVLSVEYSYMDSDGNQYNEIVTQIVNTADSIYMIPLAEIDSISFVTPKTEYNPGVINISDQLMPYVISSDEMTFVLSSSTPSNILPKVGDKLVTLEMNSKFPAGFAGEVVSVSGGVVECKKVLLEEIFKTFQNVSSTYGYQDGAYINRRMSIRAINSFGNKDFKLDTYTWSKSAEMSSKLFGSDNLALKGGTQFTVNITPSFHVISTLIINQEEGTYFSACVKGDSSIEENLLVYGGLEWNQDLLDNELLRAPVAPLTYFYIKPGMFIRASATVSSSITFTQQYTWVAAFDFSTKKRNVIKPTCGGRLKSSSISYEGAIDGSLSAGAFLELGLTIVSSDIDKLCFRGELGAEIVGHAVLYNSDIAEASKETSVYERFKNSNIAVNAFVSAAVQAECGPWGISYSLPWNLSYNIKTWDVVPTFSNTTFKQLLNPQTSANASVQMSGNCLIPIEVGLSVRSNGGEEVAGYLSSTKFDNGNKLLSHVFTDLSANKDYRLYPKVKLFDYEMLASPSADEEKREYPVKITNFMQTYSQYKENGFTNNGQVYSYKYDCAVTVSLTNDEDVADWGYVYKDPNGNVKRISLKSYGSPYTDTRYSYYRNAPNSTVCLYEYVKLVDDNEYYYGEPHDYPLVYQSFCPDGNHPHMIDLGLPSGTKWACCNVGASAPEAYGNYYAWGETAPKASYPQIHVSTLPLEQMNAIIDKGFMIAGSAYDAATVNWGSPWHMPTSGQWQEIIDNASIEWTFYNEVGGQRITGPNGNSIFLPAAGMYEGGNLLNLQIGCDYWTAALLEYGEDTYDWSNAKSYSGGMGGAGISFFNRGDGLPVRAVR